MLRFGLLKDAEERILRLFVCSESCRNFRRKERNGPDDSAAEFYEIFSTVIRTGCVTSVTNLTTTDLLLK